MKLFHVVVLIGAGCVGTLYYQRYSAVSNIASDVELSDTPVFSQGSVPRRSRFDSSPAIGPIGAGVGRRGLGRTGYHVSEEQKLSPDVLALMDGAAKGDTEKVKKLLGKAVPVNSRDSKRRTALMFAAWNGQNEICSQLLSAGANINALDNHDFSAIDYAAGRGLLETIQLLLTRSNTSDSKHALEYATIIRTVYAGDPIYLPAGRLATINRINPEGSSPLHMAAGSGLVALSQELIKRGANVNLTNGERQTPIHWAAWNNQPDTIAVLADKGAALSSSDAGGNTPLMLAAQHNALQAATALLKKGARKEGTNKQGKTAFMIAEENHYKDLAALLQ